MHAQSVHKSDRVQVSITAAKPEPPPLPHFRCKGVKQTAAYNITLSPPHADYGMDATRVTACNSHTSTQRCAHMATQAIIPTTRPSQEARRPPHMVATDTFNDTPSNTTQNTQPSSLPTGTHASHSGCPALLVRCHCCCSAAFFAFISAAYALSVCSAAASAPAMALL